MNRPKHVELLKEKLKLHMHIQDGAPCHRSKVLNKNKISVRKLSVNSPDLNQNEILLIIMKDKVACKQPRSAGNLRQAIKEVWATEITQD